MKTFSFSMLVLISSAACLPAQGPDSNESNQFKPRATSESNYYAKPAAIKIRANHILSVASSKRSGFAQIPVGNLVPPMVVPRFVAPVPVTDSRTRNGKQEATLVSMNQPIEPKYQSGSRQGLEIEVPPTAEKIFNQIGRPSPENSRGFGASTTEIEIGRVTEFESSPDPPQYRGSSSGFNGQSQGVEIGPATGFGEATTYESLPSVMPPHDETFSTQWSPVEGQSLNAADVFERVETWEPEVSQMRHVSDNFSRGGEPFAERSSQPSNFFGVDPSASCDEWANFAGCGGLKANPGHLGLPWLKSKDACDQTTMRIRFNCKRRAQGTCDCQPSQP